MDREDANPAPGHNEDDWTPHPHRLRGAAGAVVFGRRDRAPQHGHRSHQRDSQHDSVEGRRRGHHLDARTRVARHRAHPQCEHPRASSSARSNRTSMSPQRQRRAHRALITPAHAADLRQPRHVHDGPGDARHRDRGAWPPQHGHHVRAGWRAVVGAPTVRPRATGAHFFAASGHKWLLGPKRTGILWIRKDRIADVDACRCGRVLRCDEFARRSRAGPAANRPAVRIRHAERRADLRRRSRGARSSTPSASNGRGRHNRTWPNSASQGSRRIPGVRLLSPRERRRPIGHHHLRAARPR